MRYAPPPFHLAPPGALIRVPTQAIGADAGIGDASGIGVTSQQST